MDRSRLRPPGPRAWWARPAAVALALAALAACFAVPARATPGPSGPTSLAAARAEAARLQREVGRLDVKVETLAEAHAGVQARLEGLIQAAHRNQADLERSELALRATKEEYAGDVRDLYARGPLTPLELLQAAGDMHELALATGAAGVVLGRDLRALSSVGLAAGTVRARVAAASARARALGFAATHRGAGPGGRRPPRRPRRSHPPPRQVGRG